MHYMLGLACFAAFALDLSAGVATATFTSPSVSTNIYLPENSAVGTTIITLASTGGTGTVTYASTDSKVTVGGSSGIMTINDATLLNYESAATLSIAVTVQDDGGTVTDTVVVNIIDLPTLTPAMPLLCIADGATAGTAIGDVTADGSGTYTYARKASSNDANATDITVSSAGALTVSTGVTMDAGRDLFYQLSVQVTDANSEVGSWVVYVYVGCTLGFSSGSQPAGMVSLTMVMMAVISTILHTRA